MKIKNIAVSFTDHIFLFRIPLLAPVWTVFLYGAVLSNKKLEHFNNTILISMFVSFSFLVGSIYILNQIFDIESDRLNDKLFILPRKLVKLKTAWIIAILSMLVPVAYSFYIDKVLGVIFLLSAFIGILYNCKPFELKNHPLGGLLANMIGHGFLTFAAGWFSCGKYSTEFWFPAIAVTMANGAVYLCTTIVDSKGDKQTGKSTFAVRFGDMATAKSATILLTITLIIGFYIPDKKWILLSTAIASLPFFIIISFWNKPALVFQTFKVPVFVFTCGIIYTTHWYGILILFTFLFSRSYYLRRFGKNYPTFKSQ